MSIVCDRIPKSLSLAIAALATLVLLASCSAPSKTAATSAVKPGLALAEAAAQLAPDPGGQSDPFISVIRASTMSGYPQATIGQAFEAAFQDVHWQSRQPKDGTRVVTFTGLLPANLRQDCPAAKKGLAASPCAADARVTFEWTFAPGSNLFHLSRIDPEPWPEEHRSTREMMLYIYG
jgi:hypothetical protein